MARIRRRLLLALALLTGVFLSPIGMSWACVPGPFVSVEPQASGRVGATVSVVGVRFEPRPVELRWNTVEGALLTETTGPEFRADLVIPQASDGLYTIVALTRLGDGRVAYITGVSFQVVGAGSRPATASKDGSASSTKSVSHGSPSKVDFGWIAWLLGIGLVSAAVGIAIGLVMRRPRPSARNPAESTKNLTNPLAASDDNGVTKVR